MGLRKRVGVGAAIVVAVLGVAWVTFEVAKRVPQKEGIPSTRIWMENEAYDPSSASTISMVEGQDFRILVLADIQLETDPFKDPRSIDTVRTMVEGTQPDMILTVGDNTSWHFADRLALRLIGVMESFETPWAVTFGNHDSEGRGDRVWHGNRYEEAEYSLFQMGPSNIHGVGNFVISITDERGDVVYSCILMDSNEVRWYDDGSNWDFVYHDQIDWYRWVVRGIDRSAGRSVPSMAFFHIPLPEFEVAIEAWEAGELESTYTFGGVGEGVSCPPVNTGLFDALVEEGSTTHVFNGHDHLNNVSLPWNGVRMTYVTKTGPGSYSDPELQGATLVTIGAETHDVTVEHVYLADVQRTAAR